MAFTMRGLPQYGVEGPKQLSNFVRSIFGNKEQRERELKKKNATERTKEKKRNRISVCLTTLTSATTLTVRLLWSL